MIKCLKHQSVTIFFALYATINWKIVKSVLQIINANCVPMDSSLEITINAKNAQFIQKDVFYVGKAKIVSSVYPVTRPPIASKDSNVSPKLSHSLTEPQLPILLIVSKLETQLLEQLILSRLHKILKQDQGNLNRRNVKVTK